MTGRRAKVKVLLTGAFGNIGTSTLDELVKRGYEIRCFDVKNKDNEKTAKKYKGQIEVMWGDIRRPDDVARAVADQDMIIHLAFVISSAAMSATGKSSEDHPEWAKEINVGGTENMINAARALLKPPKFIFASSVSIFGRTQDQSPPRTVADPINATDFYTGHKIECEKMLRESGLDWVILRFAAVLSFNPNLDAQMFDIPLTDRIEFVHTWDVGLACANALTCEEAVGKTLLIGGGPTCQMYYRDMLSKALSTAGVGMLPDKAFDTKPFYMDWYDTTESQQLLQFQRHSFEEWREGFKKELGIKRYLALAFRPIARWYLLRQSPYYKSH